MDKIFTQRELKWLDDILPATHVKKEEAETDVEMKKMDAMDEPILIKVTVSNRVMDIRTTKLWLQNLLR